MNFRKIASIILLVVSAIIFIMAIVLGAIHLAKDNETLRVISFILVIIGSVFSLISSILRPTKKSDIKWYQYFHCKRSDIWFWYEYYITLL